MGGVNEIKSPSPFPTRETPYFLVKKSRKKGLEKGFSSFSGGRGARLVVGAGTEKHLRPESPSSLLPVAAVVWQ